ncbi:glycosyltransferase [Rhodoferax sp.]|uniref:glycosyltransferase n=1 Tax=Rhodoferax sp. TaxID=50421 RepID=UPI0026085A12|nr:glycosyltransferase [Rhodoferax sp.]MDD2919834.1 glycosyltransferase [Rhodoferax sp.]
MRNQSLTELYAGHTGKVSDKWSLYLSEYDRLLDAYRDQPVRLLEIGIQNGGSLEIWSKYFSHAVTLIGCDINPDCARLSYDDPRIHVVIGDANAHDVHARVLQHAPEFDIVIDDGSHRSSDIVKSFARYFPALVEGGVFIAEDLHCSYWGEFEGGLFDPYSSITFFKRLADVINHEHWGVDRAASSVLQGIFAKYGCAMEAQVLSQVHSVEFINSICVVRKASPAANGLGHRVVTGSQELVVSGHRHYHDSPYAEHPVINQTGNPWTARTLPPDEDNADTRLALADAQLEIARLKQSLAEYAAQASALRNSLSWRITSPLRHVLERMTFLLRAVQWLVPLMLRGGSFSNAFRMGWTLYQARGTQGVNPVYLKPVSHQAEELLVPRVLIIAELSLPQCKKYRVQQKCDMFKLLGVDCTVCNWHDTQACLDALQTHSLAIFYRVPSFPGVESLIDEARRLRITTLWEVDDFIFDRAELAKSKTLARLDRHTFDELLDGAERYRKAMLRCGAGIASTRVLAQAMKTAGMAQVRVIENALDQQTLALAAIVRSEHAGPAGGIVRIVYGSGTNTHDLDFEEAAPAIVKILAAFPQVRFRLAGTLNLPASFTPFESRIERLPLCDYETYLANLAECDISIAPLENALFNDAKSNIKFLEAAILKLPSVCSPRAAFVQVMVHGVNGFLCETDAEWEAALALLVTDSAKRAQVGEAAYLDAMRLYAPQSVARQQVLPLLAQHQRKPGTLRVLSVNCLYQPRSFGGATVVAEELNKRINAYDGYEVHVFTALPPATGAAYSCRRYEADGINVFGVVLPEPLDAREQFENPHCLSAFASVLAVLQPDVVHFHSIQGLGVGLLDVCAQKGIEYVVTLHDAWWLCGRQFMINRQGRSCGQETIDLGVCATCVDSHHLNLYRSKRLHDALHKAAALLAPSRYFADFYRANGFAKVQVNKNGIVKPGTAMRLRHTGHLRFGYVGGNTPIKGFHLVRQVFSELAGAKASLVLVDNTLNLGFSSFGPQELAGLANVEVVPAYTQRTIDAFFAGIDVLLFPTQGKESFGLTVREALARNVWVIATDAGGVAEDIVPGRNGYLVPFLDTGEGLRQAVLDTLTHYEAIRPGEPVALGATAITLFEDQAAELAAILKRVKA